jgi:hypothetical protein
MLWVFVAFLLFPVSWNRTQNLPGKKIIAYDIKHDP